MRDKDPRAVLGLPLDATRGEAQRAFRRLARQTHPDCGGSAADFRAVAGAWAALTDQLPPGCTIDDLMRRADDAMYADKTERSGRS